MIDSNDLNPSWKITIQPVMTGGDGTSSGNYLLLNNGNSTSNGNTLTKINKIVFNMNGTSNLQTMTLLSGTDDVSSIYNQIILSLPLQISFSIFNPLSVGSLNFKLLNNDAAYNPVGGNQPYFTDPVLDVFRGGDLISIDLYNAASPGIMQSVFNGTIERRQIISSYSGTDIILSLGGFGNILARSMLVNNTAEQSIQGTLANQISQTLQLGNLIKQLVDETYIGTLSPGLKFYGGITNNISEIVSTSKVKITTNAKGEVTDISLTDGSALVYDSWVFVSTPPTSSKMDVILQIIRPYQRIFYVGLDGNLTITPLQNYFDKDQKWNLDISGQATINGNLDTSNFVPILGMSNSSNTAIINNRVLCTLSQLLVQYSLINPNNTNQASVPQSLVTPPKALFPRAYDMVQSQLGMQTVIDIEAIDGNSIVSNAGLLNTALLISDGSKVAGLTSPYTIDGNQTYIASKGSKIYESMKYITASYGARALAENLKDDLLVSVTTAIKYTYLPSTQTFRTIPINQLVTLPDTTNNVFDGQRQLFCYGFDILVTQDSNGAGIQQITLHLCKPYTYTALWCDKINLLQTKTL